MTSLFIPFFLNKKERNAKFWTFSCDKLINKDVEEARVCLCRRREHASQIAGVSGLLLLTPRDTGCFSFFIRWYHTPSCGLALAPTCWPSVHQRQRALQTEANKLVGQTQQIGYAWLLRRTKGQMTIGVCFRCFLFLPAVSTICNAHGRRHTLVL